LVLPFWYRLTRVVLENGPLNGCVSRSAWVSWYQEGETSLYLNEARDDGFFWMAVASAGPYANNLLTDNHTDTSSFIFTGRVLFLTPNQQCQSTEGSFTLVSLCVQLIRFIAVFILKQAV